MNALEVLPVYGIPDIAPGDDLAALISAAAPWLRDGDVVVVTSKIVSKVEGQLVVMPAGGLEREAAREAAIQRETAREVARRGNTRIVQTHHGFVMAAAGIDASNVDRSRLVLLPKDPNASARRLRADLATRSAVDVAVIISDTMGRPWRLGLTDVALGAAGIDAIRDHRGETDPYGNELDITQMAVIDELSAAAELVKGKCDQVPVAVIRGLNVVGQPDGPGAAALLRHAEHDLFSMGTREAWTGGQLSAAAMPDSVGFTPAIAVPFPQSNSPSAALARAAAVASPYATSALRLATIDDARLVEKLLGLVDCAATTGEVVVAKAILDPGAAAADLIGAGGWLHRLRTAIAGQDVSHRWQPIRTDVAELLGPGHLYGVLIVGA